MTLPLAFVFQTFMILSSSRKRHHHVYVRGVGTVVYSVVYYELKRWVSSLNWAYFCIFSKNIKYKFMVAVLVEYIRSLNQFEIQPEVRISSKHSVRFSSISFVLVSANERGAFGNYSCHCFLIGWFLESSRVLRFLEALIYQLFPHFEVDQLATPDSFFLD